MGARFIDGVNATTRVDPGFDHINVFQSIGESSYNAFTLTLARRLRGDGRPQATIPWRAAPTTRRLPAPMSRQGNDIASDPTNLDRDKGVTPFNQTHTLVDQPCITPQCVATSLGAKLLNNNQLVVVFQTNSGLPFNIRSQPRPERRWRDERSAARHWSQHGPLSAMSCNLDLRYSRFIPYQSARSGRRSSSKPRTSSTARTSCRRESRRHHRRQPALPFGLAPTATIARASRSSEWLRLRPAHRRPVSS